MAGYSISNPPVLVIPAPMGRGNAPQFWVYQTADADATVDDSGYFTNGLALGMKVGDLVYVYDTATPKGWIHNVITVSTTTGAATLNGTGNAAALTMA